MRLYWFVLPWDCYLWDTIAMSVMWMNVTWISPLFCIMWSFECDPFWWIWWFVYVYGMFICVFHELNRCLIALCVRCAYMWKSDIGTWFELIKFIWIASHALYLEHGGKMMNEKNKSDAIEEKNVNVMWHVLRAPG